MKGQSSQGRSVREGGIVVVEGEHVLDEGGGRVVRVGVGGDGGVVGGGTNSIFRKQKPSGKVDPLIKP